MSRWGKGERLEHYLLLISVIGMMLTGAAILFYRIPDLRWLAVAMGGMDMARLLHRAFAFLLIVTAVGHVISRIVVRRLRSKIWLTWKDILYYPRTVMYHMGITKKPPPKDVLGFFDPIGKFDYWLVTVIGSIWMVGTGILLAYADRFAWLTAPFLPPYIPNYHMLVLLLHGLGFVLALFWLILHKYFYLVVYRPVAKAMFLGERKKKLKGG